MLLPQPQLEFVPVPAPVFQYELVNDRLEIPNPKETLAKKCALLSCNIRLKFYFLWFIYFARRKHLKILRESPQLKLKVCSGCRVSSYCSRECQVQDWKEGHKYRCGKSEKKDE